jgi:hypothetical protein
MPLDIYDDAWAMDIEGATLSRENALRASWQNTSVTATKLSRRLGQNRKVIRPRRARKARPYRPWPKSRDDSAKTADQFDAHSIADRWYT